MPGAPIPRTRVPLLCGPTGGAYVTDAYPLIMTIEAMRGRGLAGTRGAALVPREGTTRLARGATPMRQLGDFPYSGDEFVGEQYLGRYSMPTGSTKLGGLGAIFYSASPEAIAQATAQAGKPIMAEGEGYNDVTQNQALLRRACEIGQPRLDKQCRGLPFGTAPASGGTSGANDAEAQTIRAATSVLAAYVAAVRSGQTNPATPPNSQAMTVPPPTNSANQSLYDAYTQVRDSVPSAQLTGTAIWDLLHGGSSGGGTGTGSGSGGATTPSVTFDTASGLYKDAQGNYYQWNGTAYIPATPPSGGGGSGGAGGSYTTGSPAGSGEDIYGGDGGSGVLTAGSRAGTDVVSLGPTANSSQAASSGHHLTTAGKAGLGAGGLVLVGLAAWLVHRHRAKKRKA